MYGSKKKVNMCILNILREYTDEKHGLTQQEIIEHLEKDHEITCDRRTVKSYIDDLKDMDWQIEWENAGGTGILFISAKDTLSTISEIEKTQR
ncbi:hypothetical protein [Anaerovibrio sp.]|uniref:hypothetical protein n=1 Tax=Anaerovibrio sp. TaxID=1872532 RepID=UPI003890F05E